MKPTLRKTLMLTLAMLILAGLAYFMADLVRDIIIEPLLYLWWLLSLVYRAIPQPLLWGALILGLIYVYLAGLAGHLNFSAHRAASKVKLHGPVETLSNLITDSRKGVYFKWRIARLLANVAEYILTAQERRLPGKKLIGKDWAPPAAVAEYLEAGLNTTFADYTVPGFFAPRSNTPFDTDLVPVVEFLESELEIRDDLVKSA